MPVMVTLLSDVVVAEPEPLPVVLQYANAPPPMLIARAATAAPAISFFFIVNRFIRDAPWIELVTRLGVGFATRSTQARRPNMACGSSRRPTPEIPFAGFLCFARLRRGGQPRLPKTATPVRMTVRTRPGVGFATRSPSASATICSRRISAPPRGPWFRTRGEDGTHVAWSRQDGLSVFKKDDPYGPTRYARSCGLDLRL